jgi:hypothetical protein
MSSYEIGQKKLGGAAFSMMIAGLVTAASD